MSKPVWDVTQSRVLYNLENWGEGYFDINSQGELMVLPLQGPAAINLYELAKTLPAQGLSWPILVRFTNILHHRVNSLYQAFTTAMRQKNYSATYTAVYPIKVNQHHQVIKEILAAGPGQVGLEAGSKSELMAVLALVSQEQGLIICNGYKDREYIRLALIGQQMGLCPYLVIEKASELALIIAESQQLQIMPRYLGIRIRLASIAKGNWQNTGGEKGKFGLSATQILEVISQIQAAGLLKSLQLMHFHMGSQVAHIRDIQSALSEAARYYAELHALGVPIQTVDVGGGLGIDYDGTHSRGECSINYGIQEYANRVVQEFGNICHTHQLPQPNLITESGRAMTAHHAVLITNVIDIEASPGTQLPPPATPTDPNLIQELWNGLTQLNSRSAVETYHNAAYLLSEAYSRFAHGVLDLTQRARVEQLYAATCWQVRALLLTAPHSRLHREILDELNEKLVDKYFGNFSLFQSVPDAWAIEQLFPIIPLHRLHERPERRATLQDLTCDSDGQFKNYLDSEGIHTSLPVHIPNSDEPYLLGIFLVGAYQEILGDMHNLFGDTCSVNVQLTADDDYELVAPLEGDTVQSLLNYVHFEGGWLRNTYRKRLQAAALTTEQRQAYQRELEAGLVGYTYLES
jgi:arginine decarboxylase